MEEFPHITSSATADDPQLQERSRRCVNELRAHCEDGFPFPPEHHHPAPANAAEDAWSVVLDAGHCVVYRKQEPAGSASILMFKTRGEADVDFATAFKLAQLAELRPRFDKHCDGFRVVQELGEVPARSTANDDYPIRLTVAHNKVKSLAPMMSPRDACIFRSAVLPVTVTDDANSGDAAAAAASPAPVRDWCLIAAMSCMHPDIPENPAFVRSAIFNAGWHFKRLGPNRTRIQYVLQVDPKGWVPGFVVNLAGPRGAAEMFAAFLAEALKLQQEGQQDQQQQQ